LPSPVKDKEKNEDTNRNGELLEMQNRATRPSKHEHNKNEEVYKRLTVRDAK
jgi:hypothetical protein